MKANESKRFKTITKTKVPDGGWRDSTFAVDGVNLMLDYLKFMRYSRSRRFKKLRIQLEDYIGKQFKDLLGFVTQKTVKEIDSLVLDAPATEEFWKPFFERVFDADRDAALISILTPYLVSSLTVAYSRSNELLGIESANDLLQVRIPQIANELATQVTGINQTTQIQLRELISKEVVKGTSNREVAELIRGRFPSIAHGRSGTIARTEIATALNRGSIMSMKSHPRLLTVDVIGCQNRNDSSHYYYGRHTCNISGVPVDDANKLVFHPNHTGVIVPSSFAE